ncbi:MAG: PilZ domain-containing protein [Candidatus Omnitrophica bacterium]|nr:PilZ domain-containing protein [Candidatus Omnitrophota bacterium]
MYIEKRKFVRLNKVFPVELQIQSFEKETFDGLIQGFTRDVSLEGLCVQVNDFNNERIKNLREKNGKVVVFLNFPLKRGPIKAVANVAWVKKLAKPYPKSCLLGLHYEVIDPKELKRIMRFAKYCNAVPRIVGLSILLLLVVCSALLLKNLQLIRDNTKLFDNISKLSAEQSDIDQRLGKIQAEKEALIMMMKRSAAQVILLKKELTAVESEAQKQRGKKDEAKPNKFIEESKKLNLDLVLLREENITMEKRLLNYMSSQKKLRSQLKEIKSKRTMLEDKTLDLMRQWLISSQSSKTGLVISYDNDEGFQDVGFTYDQALSAFNFINLKQYKNAKRIFDFYKSAALKVKGGYANAYDVITGNVSEYIVHSGPSIYLALAMLRYEELTNEGSYHGVVEEIGQWLISLQNEKSDGSLPGGPDMQWSGTEHNIAAYKFFSKLFSKTKDRQYDIAAKKILSWLKNHAYNKKLKRFNRGTDDSMIATDVMSLSIIALGPSLLDEMGVDIDLLVGSIEENCKTKVRFENLLGKKVEVNGFDFCAPSSAGRGGVISVEWTYQMIIAFQILNRFYSDEQMSEKADEYKQMADYYLTELEKLLIMRANFGMRKVHAGLPYASSGGINTGHGWYTPSHSSISAAGTNFAIFAKEGYNIF